MNLYKTTKLKKLELKNHFFVPPMVSYSSDTNGGISFLQIHHYSALAQGGFGMITVEATGFEVENVGFKSGTVLSEETLESHKELIRNVKNYDAKIGIQLCDSINTKLATENKTSPEFEAKNLSKEYLDNVIKNYERATKLAIDAGYDYIEIHMAHSYLLDSYFTRTNSDWDFEKRTWLARKVLDVVTKQNIHVGIRVSAYWRKDNESEIIDQSHDLVKLLNEYKNNLEYISVSTNDNGDVDQFYNLESAYKMKQLIDLPIISASGVQTLEDALMFREKIDLVGIGSLAFKNPNILFKLAPTREDAIRITDSNFNVIARLFFTKIK
ncbi:MAG: hypothetical protein NC236_01165 [Mycoplasma sp.]|nr:hypothetical protein [Mycoplasma sp.]